MDSAALSQRVVEATLAAYATLPKHGKPAVRDNGVPEWTILASISITHGGTVTPVSLGTGVKVPPAARLPPLGDTVHDCHAEILCRRGLVRWLLHEATLVVRGEESARVLLWDAERRRFRFAPGVEVWLYVSALPCGDASTLHTMAYQPQEMADAFRAAPEHTLSPDGAVRGRKGYENYGAIRTKPGRADSPPSISFSCSDKIAAWSVLGLQGALLADLFEPIYLDHIVVGGVAEEPPSTFDVPEGETWQGMITREAERALWGRLEVVQGIPPPYRLTQPKIHLTPTPFPLSKTEVLAQHPGSNPATSNVSLSFLPEFGKAEVLANGCSGTSGWKAPGTTLLKDRMRSRLSKIEIMRAFVALRAELGDAGYPSIGEDTTYYTLKQGAESYQQAKRLLRGLPIGTLSPAWAKMLPHEFAVTAAPPDGPEPPFSGWITCGERYESFTHTGTLRRE